MFLIKLPLSIKRASSLPAALSLCSNSQPHQCRLESLESSPFHLASYSPTSSPLPSWQNKERRQKCWNWQMQGQPSSAVWVLITPHIQYSPLNVSLRNTSWTVCKNTFIRSPAKWRIRMTNGEKFPEVCVRTWWVRNEFSKGSFHQAVGYVGNNTAKVVSMSSIMIAPALRSQASI